MRGRFADSGARADHHDNLSIEFLFRRQTLQLGFLQIPVFNIEGFLLIHRFVAVDSFGATHDFDRAVVELGCDTRLALVLAPGEHAEAWD